jgi:hypothetical protein
MQRKDRYWKAIINETIFDLIEYQYPTTFLEIELARPAEFLDKELRKVSLKSGQKGRVVDVLAKIWLKNGEERWILIYIEVQGYRDPTFELRMFTAFYRIFELYGQIPLSLAIYTDNDPYWHPKMFVKKFEKTEICFKFDTLKLLDETPKTLRKGNNPFGIILETVWHSLKKNQLDEEHQKAVKVEIIRNLLNANFSKNKIRVLFDFILGYFPLADSKKQTTFEANLYETIEKEISMKTISELVDEDRRKWHAKAEKIYEREKLAAVKKATSAAAAAAAASAAAAAAEAELEKIQHIERMLVRNFDPQIISEVLNVPIQKVLDIQIRLK